MSAADSRVATLSVVLVDLDDADAGADLHRVRAPLEAQVVDRLAQRVGDAQRLFRRAVLEQHAELVAAEAREHVVRAHARLQQPGDLAQQLVAGRVAAGVVDDLELVEVDVDHRVAHMPGSARADSIALVSRLSNSRRLIRPVSASCAAW